MRVEFTADHSIVVDDDPVTGEEVEHTIQRGSVLKVDGVRGVVPLASRRGASLSRTPPSGTASEAASDRAVPWRATLGP
jgi:hypothetical protein